MEPQQVSTPASKASWLGTGLGCFGLVLGCGIALFLGLAYGLGNSGGLGNSQGNAVFQTVLVCAPIVTIIFGICWIAFRTRGAK